MKKWDINNNRGIEMDNEFTFAYWKKLHKRLKKYYKVDFCHVRGRCGKYSIFINKYGKEVWLDYETGEIFMKKYKKSDPFNS